MLKNLIIQNYALIEKLDINFENGFSVITGETGAGKSIILGAIGLLLGQRADTKAIKNGATKCVIEAHFDLTAYGMEDFFTRNELDYDPADCIIRRELHASGKSRAFINDVPAQLPLLKELGEQLIDVHSQHQNLLLNKEDFQLNVLDIIAKDNDELKTYKQTYKEYKSVETALAKAIEESKKDKAEEEFLRFQVEQLAALNLSDPNEQQEIEDEVETLSHAEDIKAELFKVDSIMTQEHGVLDMIKECSHSLANLEKMTPTVAELYQRTESAYIKVFCACKISDFLINQCVVLAENRLLLYGCVDISQNSFVAVVQRNAVFQRRKSHIVFEAFLSSFQHLYVTADVPLNAHRSYKSKPRKLVDALSAFLVGTAVQNAVFDIHQNGEISLVLDSL